MLLFRRPIWRCLVVGQRPSSASVVFIISRYPEPPPSRPPLISSNPSRSTFWFPRNYIFNRPWYCLTWSNIYFIKRNIEQSKECRRNKQYLGIKCRMKYAWFDNERLTAVWKVMTKVIYSNVPLTIERRFLLNNSLILFPYLYFRYFISLFWIL